MNDNTHSLLGAYVVNAVSESERAQFEAHLDACEDCRADVVALRETTASLADAQATAPPAHLRTRVLSHAHRTAQLPPQLRENIDASPARVAGEPAGDGDGARPDGRSVGRAGRWAAGIAAAAAVVAVAGVAIGVVGGDDGDPVALEREMMKVASAPDAHSMDLDLGQSYLVVSERMDSAVAMGHNAPMPTKGMEYQLWLVMDDGGTHPGPTFMPDDDGEFMAMMHTGFEDAAAFTVTEEPMGGSQEPSGAPLTRVDL